MKKTCAILLFLALMLTAFGQKKVAVYASDMANASDKMKTYGLILSRQLGVKVSQSSQYAAAVRTDEILAVVNKEHAYERGGSVDNNSIAEAGKQLGVDYVLVVTLIDMGDEVSLYVDWQLVNVVTAIADDADGTTYEIHNMAADLQKLADQLAERITGAGAKSSSIDAPVMKQKGDEYYEAGNYEEAVKCYRKAAEQGIADAQYNLGICYYNGVGVGKDDYEAVKWFRKAAEQGYADAQYNLGACYYNGFGVAKDDYEAEKWLRKAAKQGLTKAKEFLEEIY